MKPKHTPLLPVVVFAGTILQDANGNTLFTACEESELRGGTYDSIREMLKLAAKAINLLDGLPDVELEGLSAQGGVKAVLNRLCADNERLREQVEAAEGCFRAASGVVNDLQAENERLREALRDVCDGAAMDKARAALSATEKP